MKFNVSISRSSGSVSMIRYLLLTLLACMLFSGPVTADSIGDLAKSANTLIRNAEKAMYEKKIDQSVKLLEEARAALDALKASDPNFPQLTSLESKYDKTKKQIDRKLGSTSTSPSTPPPSQSAGTSTGDKLPAGVTKRLKDIDRELNTVERYLTKENESSVKQADYKLTEARDLFDEIDKSYGNQFDPSHPDYASTMERFSTLEERIKTSMAAVAGKKANEEADKTAMEKQSAEWIPKFQAYLSYPGNEGHNPDLLVYIPGTSEPEKFDDAQKRYEAFKSFYETYKGVEFPNGKNWKLETLADQDAPRRLADFEEQFADRINSVAGDAEKQIDQAMTYLEKDKAWEKDPGVKPPIVDKKWMVSIGTLVKNTRVALGEDSPEAAKIGKRYADLVAKDDEYRKIRADRTFLSPDIYDGKDKKELVKEAEAIVAKEKPGSKVLRITVYKEAWEEKTVEGWTDTTKTRWEKKTFKQINAQVAAKDSSGVYLHVLHLAKDKTSDGWGNVYGHIMFSDPMAEKNVKK